MPLAAVLAAAAAAAAADGATVVRVGPGELHRCAAAARTAELSVAAGGGLGSAAIPRTRCELLPGRYRESVEYAGPAPLEIVGAGPGQTVLDGSERVVQVSWQRATLPHVPNSSAIFKATLPPALRRKGVQQAFVDGAWISEARFPNTDLRKVFKKTSWADCGKGSEHGYCVDRPDAWSRLPRNVDWTGALATMLLGTHYAVWTRTVTKHGPGWFRYVGSLGPGPGSAGAAGPGQSYFLSGKLGALDSPGEWFIDEGNWTVYVWTPDSGPPADRVSIRVRDFCVDVAQSATVLRNLSMHACTFRVRNCTGCHLSDLNITYPSYHREVHLRDPTPFKGG